MTHSEKYAPAIQNNLDEFQAARSTSIWPGILFISIATLIAYSSVFSAGFIWDDTEHVISIMDLRTFEGLKKIWLEPGTTIQYYPMVFSAFWAQIQLWGLEPLGFHLVNIVLHIVNALLLWLCLKRLDLPGAFWAACIFALHPVHVESVAWVTELKNVLSTFFYLLAFLYYWQFSELRFESSEKHKQLLRYYLISLLLFICALFSKTVTCSLPAAILLLLWWKLGKIRLQDVVPLVPFVALGAMLGKLTLRVEVDHVLARGPEWDFSIMERFLIAGRVVWFYAWKLLWPFKLVFNYPRWNLNVWEWWQYLFPLGIILLFGLLWHYRDRTGRGLLTGCLFFMGTLFPVLGFLNVYSMRFSFVEDHFQYLASLGIIALVCAVSCKLLIKLPLYSNQAETIFFGGIILVLSVLTWQQGKIYNSNLTLFNDTIAKNPLSWFSYSNRAAYYAGIGEDALAKADLEKTLEIKPDEADALHHRGIIYFKDRKYEQAFSDFDRSIVIRPWRTDYYRNRCLAYRSMKQLDLARADASQIIAKEPGNAQNYLLRASIYVMQEIYEKALGDLELAEKIAPDEFEIYAERALILYRLGRFSQAISNYDMALRLDARSGETYFNRGVAHAAAGSVEQSRSDLIKARELGFHVDDAQIARVLNMAQKKMR